MQPHTGEQLAQMRQFVDAQPNGNERKTFELNGLEVTYSTVHIPDDQKPFDYAVAAFVVPRTDGEPITTDDYEIAVNDDVPEELQGVWAWHELHDFAVLGHEAEDRCVTSEQILAESMESDPDAYQNYLEYRISFYEGLAAFIVNDLTQKGSESVYSPDDLKGCYDAISFLKLQTQKIKIADELPKNSLMDAVRARRLKLNDLASQKSARAEKKAEEKRTKDESEANLAAELKKESDANAREFIELMKAYNIPMINLYIEKEVILTSETIGYGPDRHTSETARIEVSLIGQGWLVRAAETDYGRNVDKLGLILLPNGETYFCRKPRRVKKGDRSFLTSFTEVVGPEIPSSAVSIKNTYGYPKQDLDELLNAPYARKGKSMLVDKVIEHGLNRVITPQENI